MSVAALLGALVIAQAVRGAFLAAHRRDLGVYWEDLGRRGPRFQIARAISVVTLVAYAALACYAWAKLEPASSASIGSYATVFVGWFGVESLLRLPPHRFPCTDSPQRLHDAQASLIANLVTALASGALMTALAGVYFWWRG